MRISISILIILILTACMPQPTPEPVSTQIVSRPLTELQPTLLPTHSEIPPMSQNALTPSPDLEKLIEIAKTNLSRQLSIVTDEITLLDAQEVVWPDTSLGCPKPSVMYLQVLTPGYLIRFRALDRKFEFHTDKRGQMVQCANPSLPLSSIYQDR